MARARSQFIDQSTRTLEALVLFCVPFFLVRPIFPVFGIALSVALPIAYLKVTLGKPDGYLLHIVYRLGVPIPGLLPPSLKRFDR